MVTVAALPVQDPDDPEIFPSVATKVFVPAGRVATAVSSAQVRVILLETVRVLPLAGENPVTAAAVAPIPRYIELSAALRLAQVSFARE